MSRKDLMKTEMTKREEDMSSSFSSSQRYRLKFRAEVTHEWVGNDPAILFAHVETLYADSSRTEFPMHENLTQWVAMKEEFIEANEEAIWIDAMPKEIYERQLRLPLRNLYSNIEVLTTDCLGLEDALLAFVQSLIEGGVPDEEVVSNVDDSIDERVLFANAINR